MQVIMKKLLARYIVCMGLMVFFAHISSAEWAQTKGPYGGRVISLAVSDSTIFAGTLNGGVFHSANNGISWNARGSGLANFRIQSIAVCGSTIFAGTGGGGVFISTDSGIRWNAADSGLTNTWIHSLAVIGGNILQGPIVAFSFPLITA
jgi:hypothetical protein